MGEPERSWKKRPKRRSRRIAHDLRAAAPAFLIVGCLATTASVIVATEAVSVQASDTVLDAFTASEATRSARPATGEAAAPQRFVDCARRALLQDLEKLDLEDQG